MRNAPRLLLVVLAAGLLSMLAIGCAKKAKEAPPTPPAPPPVETKKEEPAPPPPAPTPAPAPKVTASDFSPAFFDFDSYALKDEAKAALDKDAKLLRDNGDLAITVEGHCDERGTDEYNQALGEKRANAARDYLVAAGIPAARIQTISYGKERPFAEGHDEAAWAQNRRAQIALR